MRFKIDWASFIVGSKFTAFALFYFVFEGNFPSTSYRRTYIWRGDLTEGFLRYRFGGLIFGGATLVEGTSVITGPKCNKSPIRNNILNPSLIKVLSVITFGPKCNNNNKLYLHDHKCTYSIAKATLREKKTAKLNFHIIAIN